MGKINECDVDTHAGGMEFEIWEISFKNIIN